MIGFNSDERVLKEYETWKAKCFNLPEVLDALKDIEYNSEEMADAFGRELTFGTSGLRGIMGYGPARMNEYVVARATAGLRNYIGKHFDNPKVIIGFDSRLNSRFFAEVAYSILENSGVEVIIFDKPIPVSLLSYGILQNKCSMGIMVTASHNPKVYNGYKVYNQFGYQIVEDEAEDIFAEIQSIGYFDNEINEPNSFNLVVEDLESKFLDDIFNASVKYDKSKEKELKIIYTPLNGGGINYVPEILHKGGFNDIIIVESQSELDGKFPTCPVPNPEKIGAYNEAFKYLDKFNGDLIIATDPDCDRVGVAVYKGNTKVLLTGNQLGLLLFDYLCQFKPTEAICGIRSIVTTPLVDKIGERYGVEVLKTLTGFKHMGKVIQRFDDEKKRDKFLFAFEESNGYLFCNFLRDKDGVSSSLLVAQMADYYKEQGISLIERLEALYDEYGTYHDKTKNFFFEGLGGIEKMNSVMAYFRTHVGNFFGGIEITSKIDYLKEDSATKSDVMEFTLRENGKFIIRPSGTEPKLKVYFFGNKDTRKIEDEVKKIITKFYN